MSMRELPEIGDVVYFNDYRGSGIGGTVVAVRERSGIREAAICVHVNNEWSTLELRHLFTDRNQAILAAAKEKQQQASRLLAEAAELFGRVIPEPDAESES